MSKNKLNVSRRDFLVGTAALSASTLINFQTSAYAKEERSSLASKKARVVIIGGGYGGISAAISLRKHNKDVDILLIEKNEFFVSCPMSNLYIGDIMEYSKLCYPYNNLTVKHNIKVLHEEVDNVDLDKKVIYTNKSKIEYDFLVLSPGIDYDIKEDQKEMLLYYPPAFKTGGEHLYLKKLLSEFEGGDIVMTVPSYPYRCPPAPYERAALVLNYLKRRNLKAKLYFIDENERPIINSEGFMNAYYELYKGYAEYITGATIKEIDYVKKVIKTSNGEFKFDIANIIPPMKASSLIEKIGLLEKGQKWVEVDAFTFETKVPNVFVIGDSARSFLPKSGFGANMQGKAVANIINERLTGKKYKQEELLMVVCYSMVSDKEAVMSETSFKLNLETKTVTPIHREDNSRKEVNVKRYYEWAKGLWREMFG